MRILFAGIVLTAALATFSAATHSAEVPEPCDELAKYAEWLDERFGERPILTGRTPGSRMLLFASPKNTWTMGEVYDDGQFCIRAFGSDLASLTPAGSPKKKGLGV